MSASRHHRLKSTRTDTKTTKGDLVNEAVCLGCGCSDSHACTHSVTGPCWWIKVDYSLGIGVCSECPEKIEEYENRVNVHHGDAETRRPA